MHLTVLGHSKRVVACMHCPERRYELQVDQPVRGRAGRPGAGPAGQVLGRPARPLALAALVTSSFAQMLCACVSAMKYSTKLVELISN